MSFFSISTPVGARQAPSLHRRFIIATAFGGAAVIVLLATGVSMLLSRDAQRQGDAQIADAAFRANIVVNEALE
ncbi:MAG: hypothetical protein ABI625_25010, partial [bacterium]